jgi:16S rRNA (uracil1498-N3)-methyltransferase
MATARLFCSALQPGTVELSEEESHHAIAVRRVKPDDELELFDGRGGCASARVRRVGHRRLEVQVDRIEQRPFELPCRLTLGVAMPKAHRQGYLVEKCTELGVAAIWPMIAARSVTKPAAPARTKWVRRAIEAAKQSGRVWIPAIETPQTFEQVVARLGDFDASALTHADASAMPLTAFLAARGSAQSVFVGIGPEGGWTDAERAQAVNAGATLVKLGPTVLRTETAAVAVCAAVALPPVN